MNRSSRWRGLSKRKQDYLLGGLILVLALAPRLSNLDVFLTADEPKSWFGRSIQFLDALARADWAATFDSPAPGVTTMWAGAIGLLLEYVKRGFAGQNLQAFLAAVPFDPLDPSILPLIRLPVALMAAVAALLTYVWGRLPLGRAGAILTAVFIALDPFLLALSRVLGHDALVAIFMWLSLLAFMRSGSGREGSQSPGFDRRYLIVSGALGGLAFLSKYPSLFLGAFVAAMMLVLCLRGRQSRHYDFRAWLLDVALWSVAAGAVFVLLWPAMWVEPFGRIQSIIHDALRASGDSHPKGSFFLGQPVDDPGGGFYVLITLFRTTPLLWIGLVLALGVSFVRVTRQKPDLPTRMVLILLAYALLYSVLITIGGKKQDRYILPAFPALAALAGLGWAWLIEKVQASNTRMFRWVIGIGVLLVLGQMTFVLPHHPYYFTYYNPLLGGGRAATRSVTVGWGEGLDQAARWLNTLPDAESLQVVSWYSTTFEPFFRGHAIYKIEEEKISRTPKPALAADYVVLYVNQIQRELPSPGALQFFLAAPSVYTVTLHGVDYAWIYPSIALPHIIADEVRLVGQAELLGYDLRDDTGEPVAVVHPDSVVYLSLYWEWQGKAENEPIGVSLVDAAGVTRGWGNPIQTTAPLPYAEWQEGMVVRDDFALLIFADTPPGQYRLTAWIDRPATGETVGVFPLEDDVTIQAVARSAE